MQDGVRVNSHLVIPARELSFRFAKSGGPGGQNVNKRETQVELIFDVAGSPSLGPRQRERALRRLVKRLDDEGRLRIIASEERTQGRNREIALERLRDLLVDALKPDPPARRPSRPSKGAKERRLAEKRARGQRKRDRAWRDEE